MTLDYAKDIDSFLTVFLEKDFHDKDFESYLIGDLCIKTQLDSKVIEKYLIIACNKNLIGKYKDVFDYYYKANDSLVLFLYNGGFKAEFKRQQQESVKQNYKEQLDTEIKERENEKLKYEEANRELDSKIKELTIKNLKLQNFQIIYGLVGALLGFVGAFLSEHWFGLIRILIKYLIK